MGQVVQFSALHYQELSPGIRRGRITNTVIGLMLAEVLLLQPNTHLEIVVPTGSDQYFYTLFGAALFKMDSIDYPIPQDAFCAIQEGSTVTISNQSQNAIELISVITPPPHYHGTKYPGFTGGIKVLPRDQQSIVEIPDQKKQRIYFVGKENAKSERAHAMIVVYQHDTVTGMHMHPNAESMFVLLTGKTKFTVNGQDHIVERGYATVFPMGDRHGLQVAEGDGVSFLEFHLPAAYTTVRG